MASNTAELRTRLVTLKVLDAALDLPCPEVDFPGDVPLPDILDLLQRHMSDETGAAIIFHADLVELELEGINSLDQVTVKDVRSPAGTQSVRQVLKLMFEQTEEPALTFVPYQGRLVVTTLARLKIRPVWAKPGSTFSATTSPDVV
ncbi:MAG: hypothetical protein R3C19_09940 [Planctomycetaceae bacterium]